MQEREQTSGTLSVLPDATIGNGFSLAAVGDLIGPFRPELPLAHPGFIAASRVLQESDVGLANQECTLLDLEHFAGYRAAENGGGYPVFPPEVAADLKAMGIDVIAKANNHATDFGVEGLMENLRILRAAGVAVAGAGRGRTAARAPAVLDTVYGRVAVISCATTFTPMSVAGEPAGEIGPRPGIHTLKVRQITLVPQADWPVIEKMAVSQGCGRALDSRAQGNAEQISLGSEIFRRSDRHGMTYEPDRHDREDLLREIRQARQIFDLVVLAMHAHETCSGDGTDRLPGDFLPVLYHEAVDAGADVIVTTGPHVLRGIEIYRGRPIHYGLGSFFLQMEAGLPVSFEQARTMGIDPYRFTKPEVSRKLFNLPDHWFDSVISRSVFTHGRLEHIELHPLRLEQRVGPHIQGAPRYASGQDADRILGVLADLCAGYGTPLSISHGIGLIEAA